MVNKTVRLQADCDARLVPLGTLVRLSKNTEVQIIQALGGSVTVNVNGNLARINAEDAHVLGENYRHKEPQQSTDACLEERVWEQLRTCYDPEIPVNIVELGLVYECRISHLIQGGTRADVRMTLTAAGCGMGGVLAAEIEEKLIRLPDVDAATVEIVYDPPWSREMMSEAAKLELGL